MLRICAACLYCDGLCPVFPALSGKHDFSIPDMSYLANLCHNCRACWHACQYAPPHVFAVNVPATLAALRRETYADHVWPRALRPAFRRPALGAGFFVAVALAVVQIVVAANGSWAALRQIRPGGFYAVAPQRLMIGLAGASLGWAVLSLSLSTLRFWRAISDDAKPRLSLRGLKLATKEIVTLRHLDGGGPGCHDAGPGFSQSRRFFHQTMVAGFVLLLAATLAAAFLQHVLSIAPPFALTSPPVGLGVAGGLAVLAGAAGLLAVEARAERAPSERGETRLNLVFLVLICHGAERPGAAFLARRAADGDRCWRCISAWSPAFSRSCRPARPCTRPSAPRRSCAPPWSGCRAGAANAKATRRSIDPTVEIRPLAPS